MMLSLLLLAAAQAADPGPPATEQPAPVPHDIEELDLAELLGIKTGEVGAFAQDLRSRGVDLYVHGYAAWWMRNNDINRNHDSWTFSAHYFNLMFGVDVSERLILEMMLEEEHGGHEHALRYAFIDTVVVKDLLVLRGGRFLVPFGVFNEYVYPEYLNELPDRPLVLWQIAPVSWAEVGAQVRGRADIGTGNINYAVYVANGLQQSDSDPEDGVIDEAGSIRDMRNNFRDYDDDGKSFGGRLGVQALGGVDLGVSGYTGPYTVDGELSLSMANADLSYLHGRWMFRSEFVRAWQQTSADPLIKQGFFVRGGFDISDVLTPVLQFDMADLGGRQSLGRTTGGLVIHPIRKVGDNFSFKLAYANTINLGSRASEPENPHEVVVQSALGF